jgi:type II secretory pathway pseudopilin PulG
VVHWISQLKQPLSGFYRQGSRFMSSGAFTLAELLIGLAVIAAISALTVPQVYTATQEGKVKASAKEALTAIQELSTAASHNDDWQEGTTTGSYITQKLNLAKACPNGTISEGCYDSTDPSGWEALYAGGVFHSGVYVHWGKTIDSSGLLFFYFDWTNGSKQFKGSLGDQMTLVCNFSGESQTRVWSGSLQPGECKPPPAEAGALAAYALLFSK